MKKLALFLFIFVLFIVFIFHNNNSPKAIISQLLKKGDIIPGDLKYGINLFGVIPMGEATLSFERQTEFKGSRVYHLNATAEPLKCYSMFFKGYAILDSYVDTHSFSPLFFKQEVEAPGKENPNKEVFYDQKNGIMTLGGVERSIFPNTQDPLSAVFNLRRTDFDNTREIEINMNTNQKNYILTGLASNKDLSINKNTFRIILLKADIKRRDKELYHKSNISMVLLKIKEKENIPLLIKVFASGVFITAKLIDIYR